MMTLTRKRKEGNDPNFNSSSTSSNIFLEEFIVTQSCIDDIIHDHTTLLQAKYEESAHTGTTENSASSAQHNVDADATKAHADAHADDDNDDSKKEEKIQQPRIRNLRLSHFASQVCFPSSLPSSNAANLACRSKSLLLNSTPTSGARFVQVGDVITYNGNGNGGSSAENNSNSIAFDRRTSVPKDPDRAQRFCNKRRNLVVSLSEEEFSHTPLRVLYEDECMAIVCKPAGVHTMSWSGTFGKSLCLDEVLPLMLKPPSFFLDDQVDDQVVDGDGSDVYDVMENDQSLPAPLPRHRLDNRVAGPVVVAKTKRASLGIGRAFEEKTVLKEYRAIVIGEIKSSPSSSSSSSSSSSLAFTIDSDIEGRSSQTDVEILGTTPCNIHGILTDVKLFPRTGRKHQLRIHCAEVLGCPILGDDLHSGNNNNNLSTSTSSVPVRERVPVRKRQGLFLYCRKVTIPHPKRKRKIKNDDDGDDSTVMVSAEIPEPLRFTRTRNKALKGYNWAVAHTADIRTRSENS